MKQTALAILAIALIFSSCKTKPYETTAKGLKYKIYKSAGGEKAKLGDIIKFDYVVTNYKDSVMVSSYKMHRPFEGKLLQTAFQTLTEGFLMLGKGDSAAFFMPADSMLKGHPDPSLKPGTLVKYTIKMEDVTPAADFEKKMKEEKDKQDAEAKLNKDKEPALLADYIKTKAPNAIKTDSGLYYVIEKDGKGPLPKAGDTIVAHYTGTLLNGKEFDSDNGKTFKFKLGVKPGEVGGVIQGWELGFALLKKGTKARLIIPSKLAYGERSFADKIPAYSPLVFEVEVVDFK